MVIKYQNGEKMSVTTHRIEFTQNGGEGKKEQIIKNNKLVFNFGLKYAPIVFLRIFT